MTDWASLVRAAWVSAATRGVVELAAQAGHLGLETIVAGALDLDVAGGRRAGSAALAGELGLGQPAGGALGLEVGVERDARSLHARLQVGDLRLHRLQVLGGLLALCHDARRQLALELADLTLEALAQACGRAEHLLDEALELGLAGVAARPVGANALGLLGQGALGVGELLGELDGATALLLQVGRRGHRGLPLAAAAGPLVGQLALRRLAGGTLGVELVAELRGGADELLAQPVDVALDRLDLLLDGELLGGDLAAQLDLRLGQPTLAVGAFARKLLVQRRLGRGALAALVVQARLQLARRRADGLDRALRLLEGGLVAGGLDARVRRLLGGALQLDARPLELRRALTENLAHVPDLALQRLLAALEVHDAVLQAVGGDLDPGDHPLGTGLVRRLALGLGQLGAQRLELLGRLLLDLAPAGQLVLEQGHARGRGVALVGELRLGASALAALPGERGVEGVGAPTDVGQRGLRLGQLSEPACEVGLGGRHRHLAGVDLGLGAADRALVGLPSLDRLGHGTARPVHLVGELLGALVGDRQAPAQVGDLGLRLTTSSLELLLGLDPLLLLGVAVLLGGAQAPLRLGERGLQLGALGADGPEALLEVDELGLQGLGRLLGVLGAAGERLGRQLRAAGAALEQHGAVDDLGRVVGRRAAQPPRRRHRQLQLARADLQGEVARQRGAQLVGYGERREHAARRRVGRVEAVPALAVADEQDQGGPRPGGRASGRRRGRARPRGSRGTHSTRSTSTGAESGGNAGCTGRQRKPWSRRQSARTRTKPRYVLEETSSPRCASDAAAAPSAARPATAANAVRREGRKRP